MNTHNHTTPLTHFLLIKLSFFSHLSTTNLLSLLKENFHSYESFERISPEKSRGIYFEFFNKLGQSRPHFIYFRSSHITNQISIKNAQLLCMAWHGIRTLGRRSSELYRPSTLNFFFVNFGFTKKIIFSILVLRSIHLEIC